MSSDRTSERQIDLLTLIAAHAPAPLPPAALTHLLQAAHRSGDMRLSALLVARPDVPEQDAFTLASSHPGTGESTCAFAARPHVSPAAVAAILTSDPRVGIARSLADRTDLSPSTYAVLAARGDDRVDESLLGNPATTAELALTVWNRGPGTPEQRWRRFQADIRDFGQLGADALGALLSTPDASADLLRCGLRVWDRLDRPTQLQLGRSIAVAAGASEKDPGRSSAQARLDDTQMHALVQRAGADPAMSAVLHEALTDPSSVYGQLVRADTRWTCAWTRALPPESWANEDVATLWSTGLAGAVTSTCGDSAARWQTMSLLAEDFTGSTSELLAVVAGINT